MQKLLFVEGKNSANFEKANVLLNDGWKVIDMQCSCPANGSNMQCFLLLEKGKDDDA